MAAHIPAAVRTRRRAVTIVALLLVTLATLTAAVAFDVLDLGTRRADLYNPERKALVEAEWQLSQAVPHGQDATSETTLTHRHIHTVLDWLDRAEAIQPRHRQRIAALREMVGELETADRAAQASAERRLHLYAEITAELKALLAPYQPASAAPGTDHRS